ncbi:hypothetical protein OKW21_000481 [Catalinimonas alkaloidigena]|uniref:hypothetical protein n=1 Tax=Catalinimonas alkaloidigena TaxID=1075417 RepID=UPI002406D0B4|nr:hypothetical protein [Catalinimonas alkaloidigena]MDF9795218.1 hypothetical protein [Catalinimonas alkaloidigena]
MFTAYYRLKERIVIALKWRIIHLTRLARKKLEKYKFLPPKPELKQEALFWEALQETGMDGEKRIDHINARCYLNDKEFYVIFPLRYLASVKKLDKTKTLHYVFVGKEEEGREWVNEFSGDKSFISLTDKGWKMPKNLFDSTYYQLLCNSKFTLCPRGKFLWTYRFYEAIMCKSIPIVDKHYEEPSMWGFKYYYYQESSTHLFSQDIVEHNYRLFLQRHTLIDEFLELVL